MLEEGEEGSVQFILLSDSIKKESKQKEDKQDAVLNSENEKEVDYFAGFNFNNSCI